MYTTCRSRRRSALCLIWCRRRVNSRRAASTSSAAAAASSSSAAAASNSQTCRPTCALVELSHPSPPAPASSATLSRHIMYI
ncbi:hypothetical protein DAI22_02g032550 [Oryza sativa Japonica Group]|nr:hypothetical protein DAI22_02g032550 [Oryza sativa Japonica Group]